MLTEQATALEGLHARLNRYPGDWVSRLALADLLEETGDAAGAAVQRWLVRHQRCPANARHKAVRQFVARPYTSPSSGPWWWFSDDPAYSNYPDAVRRACLGRAVWGEMRLAAKYVAHNGFKTRRDAEAAVAAALAASPHLTPPEDKEARK